MSTQAANGSRASPTELKLTEVEENLRKLLLDVAEYVDSTPPPAPENSQVHLPDELAKQNIVLRFTGGWVRDKLLGVGSHDIDVAINKMTGFQFGLRMKEYLEIPGNPEKYGLEGVATTDAQSNKANANSKSKLVGGLHKIEANPEKSKHLETVTTRILGLDIDLVNLRKETYTEDSRNPQMEFGTPEEDALRRDATVNAMFYNLTTQQIEDFTGRGHDDMSNGIIRTPLEPYQTFKDDPLRVLRLIRFASRLGYMIESESEHAMQNDEIKAALQAKISRERVGVELEKMLRGPDPRRALDLIDRLGLYSTIFSNPNPEERGAFEAEIDHWTSVCNFTEDFSKSESKAKGLLIRDDEEQYYMWILAAMVPYKNAPQPQPSEPGKKMPPPVAATIAREGIKATNKVCDIITSSVRNNQEISDLVQKVYDKKRRSRPLPSGEDPLARDVLGMAIRRWGPTWRSQTIFALLSHVAEEPESSTERLTEYATFLSHVEELGLLEAYTMKPILDGKALAKALSTPPGIWMKDALDVVMAWQLRNPGRTDAKEAIEEVKNANMHGELTISLIEHFLRLTIRPSFAKTQHPAITSQGRKVTTTVLPKRYETEQPDEVAKPWKGQDSHVLDLLRWVLCNLNEAVVERNWTSIIPPVLSIVDDTDTKYKTLGCQNISLLLAKTNPTLLASTGLGQVIEEALMPCLGYLPSLTPEGECIALLSAAYPALIALSRTIDTQPSNSKKPVDQYPPPRYKLLDTLVRKGVLATYAYCSENVKVVETSLNNLISINNELGIDSVKHLKYVLPMLSEVLGQPLGHAYPPLLLAATKALQSVILNGWPRMAYNRGEVLKGLTLCWVHVHDEHSEEVEQLKKALKDTASMLKDAVSAKCDIESDFEALIAADGRLRELFRLD